MTQTSNIHSPVTVLKGVSSVRQKQFERLGIRTLGDLISFFPRAYEDRTKIVSIRDLTPDEPACFEAMVVSTAKTSRIRKGLDITKVQVADMSGKLTLVFFNQPYIADSLHYGESYLFYGTLRRDVGSQVQNPVFEPIDRAGTVTGRYFPIYPLTAGLSNNVVLKCVRQALDLCLDEIEEVLPDQVRERFGLCAVKFAYETIHAPQNETALEAARRRLVFEEFFVFSAGLQLLRNRRCVQTRAAYDCSCIEQFTKTLPFTLTNAQQNAIRDVLQDLSAGRPMNRLIQGDVGSGKTMVAAAAAFCTIKNAQQAAVMVPTEILAEQHYESLGKLMQTFGISTVLLTSSLTAVQKRRIKAQIADGTAQLIIGTQALFTDDVTFSDLGLVVADEQHRFGVAQRTALSQKGDAPHLLVMSATPIPRTLALIAYGELDISVIGELPPGRQTIDTFLVGEDMRKRINAFIRKQCELGGQVYIVCPAVEESELESLKSAQMWAQTLQTVVFPDLRVGLLHGKMKGTEKDAVMTAFSKHEIDILVSTTVIEVGVDVPNATLMIVENADRFGLSQLHQLRGRVGRGSQKSYCVLFSANRSPDTLARLKALCETNDGFAIAQKDLQMRGPGDFFGSRQHGLPIFRSANLELDMHTLEQAQQAAADTLTDDWENDEAFILLKSRVQSLFESLPPRLN